jgi:hypothetical protein
MGPVLIPGDWRAKDDWLCKTFSQVLRVKPTADKSRPIREGRYEAAVLSLTQIIP